MLKKRKKTVKRIGTIAVWTNQKFTKDEELSLTIVDDLEAVLNRLRKDMARLVRCGIAIGRARATASGKKRKEKTSNG